MIDVNLVIVAEVRESDKLLRVKLLGIRLFKWLVAHEILKRRNARGAGMTCCQT